MMNQSASATRRPAAGSNATAGCCPMLLHPYFVNTFSPQAPLPPQPAVQQCLLGAQSQLHPHSATATTTITPSVTNGAPQANSGQQVGANAMPALANSTSGQAMGNVLPIISDQQRQQAPRQDHNSTYNSSVSAQTTLAMQQLLASQHPASNCVALAAAIAASASYHSHLHARQPQHQNHPTPINHSTNSHNASQPVRTNSINTNTTNQVPILNFNSYNAAQPFLNLPAPAPLAAHHNSGNNHHLHQQPPTQNQPMNVHQQPHSITAQQQATVNPNTGNQVSNSNGHQRPLATNTTLNSAANQQNNYRPAPLQSTIQQQAAPEPQPLIQGGGNLTSDETFGTLFGEHFQNLILNQLFANSPFVPPVVPPPPSSVSTASGPPQAPTSNASRHVSPPPASVQPPVVIPAHQVGPTNAQQQQQPSEPRTVEQVQHTQSNFQPVSQATAQSRLAPASSVDTYSSSADTSSNNLYQQQQQHSTPVNHQPTTEQVPIQQQQQQPQTIPPLSFYSFPQVEQALALLSTPQIANNLFSFLNLYAQVGIRPEPHHTHHHHHPLHHYHHHLHGSHHHHHHHHGPNGQNNGQDDTMLTISESKPRGLNRAEIDSLTPYLQMNEKDSRTCVICLSKFELKAKIRPLPCNHAFHAKCVDKWLRANRTCPICRRDALKTYGAKIKRI